MTTARSSAFKAGRNPRFFYAPAKAARALSCRIIQSMENELTVDDLKAEIPAQDLETLTLGDDTVAVRALLKGKVAVKGMVLSAGGKYSEENEVVREAVLKWALYELFAFVGQESRAREKQEDCQLLIETNFGPIAKKTDATLTGPAVGFVSAGRKSPMERRR